MAFILLDKLSLRQHLRSISRITPTTIVIPTFNEDEIQTIDQNQNISSQAVRHGFLSRPS